MCGGLDVLDEDNSGQVWPGTGFPPVGEMSPAGELEVGDFACTWTVQCVKLLSQSAHRAYGSCLDMFDESE